MKAILLFLLIGLTLSYSTSGALSYAKKYCSSYNRNYYKYDGKDCANFVSQCMHEGGGQDFSGCGGKDAKGMIPAVANLKSCLKSKGWKSSSTKPKGFVAGYPVFVKSYSHAMLAGGFSGSDVLCYSHTNERCNEPYAASKLDFYYK